MVGGFRGSKNVSLDSKGRVAIPSRYRDRLVVDAGGCLVQTLNPLDRSLWLYPLPEWELIEEKLADLSDFNRQSRRIKQMMRGNATDCQLDAHGRILIPAELRDYAQISKQAIIMGQGNKFEIWNKASWEEVSKDFSIQEGDEQGEPAGALQLMSF